MSETLENRVEQNDEVCISIANPSEEELNAAQMLMQVLGKYADPTPIDIVGEHLSEISALDYITEAEANGADIETLGD